MSFLRCAEAAKILGISSSQMRRLDAIGELQPCHVTSGGQREYSVQQIDWFKKILKIRTEKIRLKRSLAYKDSNPVDYKKEPERYKVWSEECLRIEAEINRLDEELQVLQKEGPKVEEEFSI